MQNMKEIFLYMKEEIESMAKKEEEAILHDVKVLEDVAYEQMKVEAKRNADVQGKQELAEISSEAANEIATSHTERTRRLIEIREGYVKDIFEKAKEKLVTFSQSKDYPAFMENKIKEVSSYHLDHSILFLQDMHLKDQLVNAYGMHLEVKEDPTIEIGGFKVENQENQLVLDETLDTALKNQREWFNQNSGLTIQ